MIPRLSAATLERARGGVQLPDYDRSELKTGVLHFGLGAFHRSHQASYFDDLASQEAGWGITGVSLNNANARDALAPQDGLYTLVTRGEGGGQRVIGALREALVAHSQREEVARVWRSPDLRMVTITVTEKGYPFDAVGMFDPDRSGVAADVFTSSDSTRLTGSLIEGFRMRRALSLPPPVVLSCDNINGNGSKLGRAVVAHARNMERGLAEWIEGEVRFPDTMVDSITPATTDSLRAEVSLRSGLSDQWPVEREIYRRWVIEAMDVPALGRLEDVGAILTSDVAGHADAKLRILNAIHSTLAYCGLLRGYTTVAQAMADEELATLCRRLAHEDVKPSLDVPSLDLPNYIEEILRRIANPAIEHRLEQIAVDGSRKLAVRIMPTIAAALAAGRRIDRLVVPLAAWIGFVTVRARSGMVIPDPDEAMLATAGTACSRASGNEAAIFHAAYPSFGKEMWRNSSFLECMDTAFRGLRIASQS